MVEDLGFTRFGGSDQVLVQNLEDVFADLSEFLLDLLSVVLDELNLSLVALGFLLLLDRSDDSPRGTSGADDVLVGH